MDEPTAREVVECIATICGPDSRTGRFLSEADYIKRPVFSFEDRGIVIREGE